MIRSEMPVHLLGLSDADRDLWGQLTDARFERDTLLAAARVARDALATSLAASPALRPAWLQLVAAIAQAEGHGPPEPPAPAAWDAERYGPLVQIEPEDPRAA